MTREPRSPYRPQPWLAGMLPLFMSLTDQILYGMVDGSIDLSDRPLLGPNAPLFLNAAHALLDVAARQAELIEVPGPWTLWFHGTLHDEKDKGPWENDEGPNVDTPGADWLDDVLRGTQKASEDRETRRNAGMLLSAFGFCRTRRRQAQEPYSRAQATTWFAIWLARRAMPPADALIWLERHCAFALACDLAAWGSDWPPGWKVPEIDPVLMYEAHQSRARAAGSLAAGGRA